MRLGRAALTLCALLLVTLGWHGEARAFCGFYVGGAGAELYNNATLVVMMREGERTVLSMQNNYQGPPKKFAMVVPVPVVLQQENVKTLPRDVFDRVDQLAAPRLVEYWEQDPCYRPPPMKYKSAGPPPMARPTPQPAPPPAAYQVKIEAQFTVGEYDIVILSAGDSAGLDSWLKDNGYSIPAGAEPVLRPYVQQGMKFFVAKVDPAKVTFENGQAMLSPLRFHYDTPHFALPVRLGLLSAKGKQDLIVHILAPDQRYEVANYDNVTIPTNLEVPTQTNQRFGEFYAALFDAVLEKHPNAVVTEYAWQSSSCDPCPTPPLRPNDLATLGADVLPSAATANNPPPGSPTGPAAPPMWRPPPAARGMVLTRLHARYDKSALGEDLVFRKADAIVGGREFMAEGGQLERGAIDSTMNNFQGRYIIRHAWTGPIACANPRRGIWGGPPSGHKYQGPKAAQDLAFAPRGQLQLNKFAKPEVLGWTKLTKGSPMGLTGSIGSAPKASDLPEPSDPAGGEPPGPAPAGVPATPSQPNGPPSPPPSAGGCGGCATNGGEHTGWVWALALLAWGLARRRR